MRRLVILALIAAAAARVHGADTEEQRLKGYIKQSRSSDEGNRTSWKTDKESYVQSAARDALEKLGEKVY